MKMVSIVLKYSISNIRGLVIFMVEAKCLKLFVVYKFDKNRPHKNFSL
ncbi:protein of unknown function [Bartonella clarridgeiae 73]|uniref:Uncharacterized protein n=1 Tax=Bartonella clarridgeiae (strain CCUG 45776 / CIP 104772 / 73) TaxID=696125 RepID=E6YHM5_BARC7|nr:protein of unknown function [Bartonella clarridgeiae 73]